MSTIPEIQPVRALFAKKGGTWDMDIDANGKLIGVGNLGDAEIHNLMDQRGLLNILPRQERILRERDFSVYLERRFQETQPLDTPLERYFAAWCPDFGNYVKGEFYPFFSGDSSHLTHPFAAAISTNLIKRRIEDPTRIVMGAEGTDTADLAFLNLDDVLTFDTDLPVEPFTGGNQSRHEANSDTPPNFLRLARIAVVDPSLYLPDPRYKSGSFWTFHKYIYAGADVSKFDPREQTLFENQDTFFSENTYAILDDGTLTVFRMNKLGDESTKRREVYPYEETVNPGWLLTRETPPLTHISRQLTAEKLYDALVSVYTVDLGTQNPLADEIEKVLDPTYKAIVVAAHGLGNGPEQLKAALVEAAKQGKIVIITSRAFIPYVSERYGESLLSANENPKELGNTSSIIISGQHLSKTAARAIATRAILEGLNQTETEQLLKGYSEARPPQYGKEVQPEPAVVFPRGRRGRTQVAGSESKPPVEDKNANQLKEEFIEIWSTKPPSVEQEAEERYQEHISLSRIPDNFDWDAAREEAAKNRSTMIDKQLEHMEQILPTMHLSRYAKRFIAEVLAKALQSDQAPTSIVSLNVILGEKSEKSFALFNRNHDLTIRDESLTGQEEIRMSDTVFETLFDLEIGLYRSYQYLKYDPSYDDAWWEDWKNKSKTMVDILQQIDKEKDQE